MSVIVPNFNHEDFLARRLESILNQTFSDFELIFLDDASTDGSLNVLRRYEHDERIRTSVNTHNSGSPFRQWNKGLAAARGEFIWIAESDDYADPEFLEVMVAALEEHPTAGLAYCQSWLVGLDSSEAPTVKLEYAYANFRDRGRWKGNFENAGRDEISNYLVYRNTIPNASAVVFRRSVLSGRVTAPENMKLAGDWLFWTRILIRADIVFRSRPMNYFRVPHAGSQRNKTKNLGLELLEGLEVYREADQHGLLDARTQKRVLAYQLKVWGSLACFRRFPLQTNRAIYRKLLDVHGEVRSKRLSSIMLPFLIYFASAPLRSVPWLAAGYKRVKFGLMDYLDSRRAA